MTGVQTCALSDLLGADWGWETGPTGFQGWNQEQRLRGPLGEEAPSSSSGRKTEMRPPISKRLEKLLDSSTLTSGPLSPPDILHPGCDPVMR